MAKRRVLVPERLPAVRASEYVCVSVELPKGLHAKAQEIAQAYGLSLSACLRSRAYEHGGLDARLKPGEMVRLLWGHRRKRQLCPGAAYWRSADLANGIATTPKK